MDVADNTEQNSKMKKKEKGLQCSLCETRFTFPTNLYRHMKNMHRMAENCIMPGCRAKFPNKDELLSHIEKEHGTNTQLTFASLEDFYAWKLREEVQNFVCFTKRCGDQSISSVIIQRYICHLSRKVAAKEMLAKTDLFCPARMIVKHCKLTGKVTVIYFKSHSHVLTYSGTQQLPIPDCLRHEIKQKLKKGLSVDQILLEFQNRHKSQLGVSVAMYNRLQSINRSQICVIKRHLIKKGKLSEGMTEETDGQVEENVENSTGHVSEGAESIECAQQPNSPVEDNFPQELLFSTQPESSGYEVSQVQDSSRLQGMFKQILILLENENVCKTMLPYLVAGTEKMLTLCKEEASSKDVSQHVEIVEEAASSNDVSLHVEIVEERASSNEVSLHVEIVEEEVTSAAATLTML